MAKPVHRPFLVLLFFVFAVFEQALSHLHRPHVIRGPCKSSSRPGAHNCTQKFYKQKKDHFSYRPGATPYLQQYLTYDEYWRGPGGPVFFYGAASSACDAPDVVANRPASVDGNASQAASWRRVPSD